MKSLDAVRFPEANKKLLKPEEMTDEECGSLWVYTDGYGCISCWRLTFIQRLSVLLFGRIWLCCLTGYTQPPVWVSPERTVFSKNAKDGKGGKI